eukprot:COSAG05_NODE_6297_length_985_cov_0.958239_1_plen_88_part_00
MHKIIFILQGTCCLRALVAAHTWACQPCNLEQVEEETVLDAVRRWWACDRGVRTRDLPVLAPLIRWPQLGLECQLGLASDDLVIAMM